MQSCPTANGWRILLEISRNTLLFNYSSLHTTNSLFRIVPPVLKEIVACTAIRHGSDLEWMFAYKRFRESNVASERRTLLSSMTCSQETWILAR